MGIPITPPPGPPPLLPPPPWWMQLTENQRLTVIARLRKLGVEATHVDTTVWPR